MDQFTMSDLLKQIYKIKETAARKGVKGPLCIYLTEIQARCLEKVISRELKKAAPSMYSGRRMKNIPTTEMPRDYMNGMSEERGLIGNIAGVYLINTGKEMFGHL